MKPTYDHTDAAQSPMVVSEAEAEAHRERVRLALEATVLVHGETLRRLADTEPDPHTRIGY